jgi:Lhr-like helicase
MQIEGSSSVFELLAKPVRKALVTLGFSEPTLPQILAFPAVLEGGEDSVFADKRILG